MPSLGHRPRSQDGARSAFCRGLLIPGQMRSRTVLQAIPPAVAALGINAIPAGIVLLRGQSAETAMVLYFFENLLSILFTASRVRILAPAHDRAYASAAPDQTRLKVAGRIVVQKQVAHDRRSLLEGYLIFSLSFSVVSGVFLFLFLYLILGASISVTVILSGLVGIAGFQLLNFVTDLFLLGHLSPRGAEVLLERSMGRVALLYLAVGAGAFLALMEEKWFILPFAVLKTIADLAAPIQALGARNQRPESG